MPYLTQFLTVAGIHILAGMSPGPDFVMITRQAIIYSRRTGVYSALGLGLGILVHVVYSLAGIGIVIANSILFFSIMKFVGGVYLVYLGYKSLRAKSFTPSPECHECELVDEWSYTRSELPQCHGRKPVVTGFTLQNNTSIGQGEDITPFSAIKIGFLTNVTNPKVTLFFLSLFTIVIDPATPLWIQILYGLEMSVATVFWFVIIAVFFSSDVLKNKFGKVQNYIGKFTGAVLIFFGIKLALINARK